MLGIFHFALRVLLLCDGESGVVSMKIYQESHEGLLTKVRAEFWITSWVPSEPVANIRKGNELTTTSTEYFFQSLNCRTFDDMI